MPVESEIAQVFQKHFLFPHKPLFGAVATVCGDQPRVRTMRVYDFDQDGSLILTTHTDSNKWKDFTSTPKVSVVFVTENHQVQVIVNGNLRLETATSADTAIKEYWDQVRTDVKKIYDPHYVVGGVYQKGAQLCVPPTPPSTFGVASVIPTFWEILHLDSEYTHSQRYQFSLCQGNWQKQRVQVG